MFDNIINKLYTYYDGYVNGNTTTLEGEIRQLSNTFKSYGKETHNDFVTSLKNDRHGASALLSVENRCKLPYMNCYNTTNEKMNTVDFYKLMDSLIIK